MSKLSSDTRRKTMLGFQPPAIGDEEIAAVAETLRSGWLTTGPRAAELERRMAEYLQAEHVLALAVALGQEIHPQQLSPAPKAGGGCVRFLVALQGELRDVRGLEEAFALDGVKGIRLYRRAGHMFGPLRRGSDRAGAILAVGDSREQALARADEAAGLIRFDTAPVEKPLQKV
jgi:hypothetical protein